ncbi:MAG TPA: GMC family oxidoreductase [Candidatus Binatia bacterium]|nr:GMC family oxidoreductase [Candidatus Binatia bacterium]
MIVRPDDQPGDLVEHTDVAVVGTGAGGAVLAAELAEAGMRVIMVEEGDAHTAADFTARPLEQIRMLYRDRGMTGAIGNTFIGIPLGRTVGGTTTINSGTCWRAPDAVLHRWETEFGIPNVAAGGLTPEFERVERAIHVQAVPEPLLGPAARLFRRGAEALGFHGEAIPRNAAGCRGTGVCAFGCPRDAKQAMHVSYVPRALRAGARLHARARVERVLLSDGRAVGVVAKRLDPDGRWNGARVWVLADRVVVAAGALLTPVLLARSGIRRRPLGRSLRIHPATRVLALFDEPVRAWDGVPQSYHVHEFESEGIFLQGMVVPPALQAATLPGFGFAHKERMAAFDRLASFGALISDTTTGRVFAAGGQSLVWYWMNRDDARRLLRAVSLCARIFFAAGAREVYPGVRQQPVIRSMAEAEALERVAVRPRDLEMMAFHPMGTARMGSDPSTCAVAPSGEVYGTAGLYVADASVFPTSTRVNPQITIMAMATRIAAGIAACPRLQATPAETLPRPASVAA